MSNRSIVINDDVEVEIIPDDGQDELVLSVDGRSPRQLAPNTPIKI